MFLETEDDLEPHKEAEHKVKKKAVPFYPMDKNFLMLMARSHGLVVKGEDSQLSGCGFKSSHRILDGCKQC